MRLLKALRREPVDRTPVWFMRQAGRYMAEYRKLREKHSILEICRSAELAAEVTLQPIRRFPGLDAAIIFSDILLIVEPMGIRVAFVKGEGPEIQNPVATAADIEGLRPVEPERDLTPVLDAIRAVKRELTVPLIGFAGAPFTLASYLVEGGPSRDHRITKQLMYSQTGLWNDLLERLSHIAADFLRIQVEAGASAVQLFDSWAGTLSPSDYETYVAPHSRRVLESVADLGVPRIHFGVGTGELLDQMGDVGADVVGVDWRVPLDRAIEKVGPGRSVQGNLDPTLLFAPADVLHTKAAAAIERGRSARGHVFNLGHGVLPQTDPDAVKGLVDFVHGYERV